MSSGLNWIHFEGLSPSLCNFQIQAVCLSLGHHSINICCFLLYLSCLVFHPSWAVYSILFHIPGLFLCFLCLECLVLLISSYPLLKLIPPGKFLLLLLTSSLEKLCANLILSCLCFIASFHVNDVSMSIFPFFDKCDPSASAMIDETQQTLNQYLFNEFLHPSFTFYRVALCLDNYWVYKENKPQIPCMETS